MNKALVSAITAIGDDIRIVQIKPQAPLSYAAGQYVDLTFDGFDPRPFSIANAPGDDVIEFHIRTLGDGARGYVGTGLKVGDTVDVSAPKGRAVYVRDCTRPIMAIAGGIGMAPVKAILEQAVTDNHNAPIRLYWGGRVMNDLYLQTAIEDLAARHDDFEITYALSDQKEPGIRHGLVGAIALADHPDLSDYRLYIGGPPAMIEALAPDLLAAGADPALITCDTVITMARPEKRHG